MRFDDNKKEIWRYKYNTDGSKKLYTTLSVLERDENYMYCILKKVNDKQKTFNLMVLDMKTGKETSNKPITGLSDDTVDNIESFYSNYRKLDNDKTFDDKIVLLGRNYDDSESVGFARMILNKSDFSVDMKAINYEPNISAFLPKVNKYGMVESGYMLQTKDMYFMNDGSGVFYAKNINRQGNTTSKDYRSCVYLHR